MDRRFLLSAAAITVWTQQASPATAKEEAALRARAEKFFEMQVDKKYRAAETLVAEDSKDGYYNGSKYSIKSFSIEKVELLDRNTRARVTIKAKVTLVMPGVGAMDFDAPSTSLWKLENHHWVWYIDPKAGLQTPFGALKPGVSTEKPVLPQVGGNAPDVSTLQALVKIDRDSIVVTPGAPQTVTVTNGLPGGVDLELRSGDIPGLSSELEKKHLEAGEKTSIRFSASGEEKGDGVVHLLISPLTSQLDIKVKVN